MEKCADELGVFRGFFHTYAPNLRMNVHARQGAESSTSIERDVEDLVISTRACSVCSGIELILGLLLEMGTDL